MPYHDQFKEEHERWERKSEEIQWTCFCILSAGAALVAIMIMVLL